MFNLQGSEIIFILLLALVVLGPEKLPGAIRRFTRTYAELRKMGTSFQEEVKSAFDEPMREVRETADLIRQQVDVESLEAEHAATSPTATTKPTSSEPTDQAATDDPFAPPTAGTAQDAPAPTPPRPNVPAPPPPFSATGDGGAVEQPTGADESSEPDGTEASS